MKRWIGLLSVLLACILICAGCASKKDNADKVLYPKDVAGKFVSKDGIEGLTENVNGGTYTNEHFGIKAEFSSSLIVDHPGAPNDAEPTDIVSEVNVHNSDYSFQHYITVYTRSSLHEGFKYAPAEDISRIYMESFASGMGGEVVNETHAEEYHLMGKTIIGYTADVKLTRKDTREEYIAHISNITVEVDLYLCDLLTISYSKKETQNFLNETYSELK